MWELGAARDLECQGMKGYDVGATEAWGGAGSMHTKVHKLDEDGAVLAQCVPRCASLV